MKFNIFFVMMVIVFFLFCSCSEKTEDRAGAGPAGEASKIKIETIDGIPHVYNTATPVKGEVTLELEKVLEIDSLDIDQEKPPTFLQFIRYGDRVYLFDVLRFNIYIFDTGGKLLTQLQIKGQGPGEIERVTQFALAPRDNDLWILSDSKIIQFNREGKLLDELKLQTRYRNISLAGENAFIGKHFVLNPNETDKQKQQILSCVMFDREEKELTHYLEGEGLGGLTVVGQVSGGRTFRFVFVAPALVPDIVFGVDQARQSIYLCKNNDYVIFLKNLKGEMLRVIHREHKNIELKEEDRKEVVDQQFFGQPDDFKKVLSDNLPPTFCAILSLHPLPNGYLAVYRITGPQKYVVDIFDPEGRYIYQLKFPGGIKFPTMLFYPGGVIGVVQKVEDRDIYREYRIKNLTEIFPN